MNKKEIIKISENIIETYQEYINEGYTTEQAKKKTINIIKEIIKATKKKEERK